MVLCKGIYAVNPKSVTIDAKEMADLLERVSQSALSEKDKKLIAGVFSFNHWLQTQLAHAKLSIKRLRAIFGFKTEKKK